MDSASPPPGYLADGFAYWNRIRGDRPIPLRADFDPIEVPVLLARSMIVDVLTDPLDFRFRLIGSLVERIVARRYKGVCFSELAHMKEGNKIWDEYKEVAATGQPLWSEIAYVGPERYVKAVRHCLLPMSRRDTEIDQIFVVVDIDSDYPGIGV